MPRFYKKTALGFMSEAEDPDDPEVTEVRLTADEFQRLREQIARFRKEAEVARLSIIIGLTKIQRYIVVMFVKR